MSDAIKNITIKNAGRGEAQFIQVTPGTTVADINRELGLGPDFTLADPKDPDAQFHPTDVLFPRINDGDMLNVTALADAGSQPSQDLELQELTSEEFKLQELTSEEFKLQELIDYNTLIKHLLRVARVR